jgi:hypothetical protein
VGDGQSINIWGDKWLPQPAPYSIQSPVNILDGSAKVSELLDRDTNWWKTDLIHEVFTFEEATKICSIAVCPIRNNDHRAWVGTASGDYTVKSGYHLAKEKFAAEQESCSNKHESKQHWNNIWAIKGSRVVKMFVWKACMNILPTKELLVRKHVLTDPLCPICKLVPETIDHALWNCSSARDVWSVCSGKLQKCASETNDFSALIGTLMERLSMEEMQEMVTVARLIWLRRNKFVFDGEFTSPDALVRTAYEQLEAYNQAELRLHRNDSIPTAPVNEVWQKPPIGSIKVNWDAAVDKARNRVGLGIIARDSNGQPVVM